MAACRGHCSYTPKRHYEGLINFTHDFMILTKSLYGLSFLTASIITLIWADLLIGL